MVLATAEQVLAAQRGDMKKAADHELIQNKLAAQLGCRPGFERM